MRATSCLLVIALLLVACDPPTTVPPDTSGTDAGPPRDVGPVDAPSPIDAPAGVTSFAGPSDGDEVMFSLVARIDAPEAAARVVVALEDDETVSCEATERRFECLLDVTALPAGPFTIIATSFDAGGAELGSATLDLMHRDLPNPCEGMSGDATDCVLALATAGTAAGFTGMTYINGDDTHARADTSRMTGIDARVMMNPPAAPLDDVAMGIVNESRSCNPTGGWISIPRCGLRAPVPLFDANMLSFWPEHRDHGMRDYYQWQAPFFVLSQGSSGTELDEVNKSLLAMAILRPAVRAALAEDGLVAAVIASLLRRSRVGSDLELMTQEGQVVALRDADNLATMLAMAAAIREGELPPIAEVTADATGIPAAWMFGPSQTSDYAVGWAPFAVPTETPAGRFTVTVDLSGSRDPEDEALSFFPVLLRGDPDDVVITRANEEGTEWSIEGSHPTDRTIATGAHDRIVSRVTVGFFPHDGMWLGAPALVSIGGRPNQEIAPDSNDLD